MSGPNAKPAMAGTNVKHALSGADVKSATSGANVTSVTKIKSAASGANVTSVTKIKSAASGANVTSVSKVKSVASGAIVGAAASAASVRSSMLEEEPPPRPRMKPFSIKSMKRISLEFAQKDVTPKQPVVKKDCDCFNDIHRIHSALWNDESVPFKLYEVQRRPAQKLDVHVLRGKGITKGWFRDIMDTPDPYLLLRIPGTPNGVKRTKTLANTKDPVWDEHFYFYIDPYCTPKLGSVK